jgi:hypothetical protein
MGFIIADQEFYRGASRIQEISDELLEIINSFGTIINHLLEEGICDVAVNNVLTEKTTALNSYAELLSGITCNIVEYTGNFIAELDDADSYLYD